MREIKFRGKKKSDGKWIVGNYNLIDDRTYIFNHDPNGDNLNSPDDYEVIPETVGQFTGILDKEGVEVYEGDIVKSDHKNRKFTILWIYKGWKMKWNDGLSAHADIYSKYVKVIGNIHEYEKQTP